MTIAATMVIQKSDTLFHPYSGSVKVLNMNVLRSFISSMMHIGKYIPILPMMKKKSYDLDVLMIRAASFMKLDLWLG